MNLLEHFPLVVADADVGLRLDQILVRRFEGVSRARWGRLIDSGCLRSEGRVLAAANKLKAGQAVEFHPSEEFKKEARTQATLSGASEEKLAFEGQVPEILFEDDDLLVINKPVGLAVHPGSGLPLEKTLLAWLIAENKISQDSLRAYLRTDAEIVETQRPGIVHRLDQGTSGALVVAKNPEVHRKLSEQFATREAGRLYWATVRGDPAQLLEKRPSRFDELLTLRPSPVAFRSEESGLFSFASYLQRDAQSRTRFRVSGAPEGKKALTHFCKVKSNGHWSLLELKLETGRTHQIRVHLQFLDLPILGDPLYGGEAFRRMMLHAHRLQLTHPTGGQKMQFEARWPEADREWLVAQDLTPESVISRLIAPAV